MYSIWGKKSKEAEAEKKKPRTSAAQIRVQKGTNPWTHLVDELPLTTFICLDLAELDIPDTIKLDFPDPSNILNFNVTIHPDEGNLFPRSLAFSLVWFKKTKILMYKS